MWKAAEVAFWSGLGVLAAISVTCPSSSWAAERARTETPYSNRSVQRERAVREAAREIDRDRDRRYEKREYDYQRRARERDRDDDE